MAKLNWWESLRPCPTAWWRVLQTVCWTPLKTTPYFRAAGLPLEVELSGKFVSNYVEKPFLAVHNYEVQIPYQ